LELLRTDDLNLEAHVLGQGAPESLRGFLILRAADRIHRRADDAEAVVAKRDTGKPRELPRPRHFCLEVAHSKNAPECSCTLGAESKHRRGRSVARRTDRP